MVQSRDKGFRMHIVIWLTMLAILTMGLFLPTSSVAEYGDDCLYLPSSLTAIRSRAFAGCHSQAVVFPEGLREIFDYAFADSSIQSFAEIPKSVEYISAHAFDGVSDDARFYTVKDSYADKRLESLGFQCFHDIEDASNGFTYIVTVEPDGSSSATIVGYKGATMDTDMVIPASIDGYPVRHVGYSYQPDCSWKQSINGKLVLPDSVLSIEDGACSDCAGLTSVRLSASLTRIGRDAFFECVNLGGTLELPTTLREIGSNAFYRCSGLTGELVLPAALTTLGDEAFCWCSGLTGVSMSSTHIRSIGVATFGSCTGLQGSLLLPSTVRSIGNEAFSYCSGLNGTLSLPTGLTEIGDSAFSGCSGLSGSLVLPSSLCDIGSNAFENCAGFTGSLVIPEKIDWLNDHVFQGCSGFDGKLTLPSNLLHIGMRAFMDCTGLSGELSLPISITTIEEGAFKNCGQLTGLLVVPNLKTAGCEMFSRCLGVSGIVVGPDTKFYYEGTYYSGDAFYKSRDGSNPFVIYGVAGSDAEHFAELARQYKGQVVFKALRVDFQGKGIPNGVLYQGDPFSFGSYLSSGLPIGMIEAIITDNSTGVVAQSYCGSPNVEYISLQTWLDPRFQFETLPLGTYTFTLRADMSGTMMIVAQKQFTIVKAPVRPKLYNFTLVNGIMGDGYRFTGSLACNYPIDKVKARIVNLKDSSLRWDYAYTPTTKETRLEFSQFGWQVDTAAMKSKAEFLSQFQMCIELEANGKTATVYDTTFVYNQAGSAYSVAQVRAIREFVSKPESRLLFDSFNDGIDYLANMGLDDTLSIAFTSYDEILKSKIRDRLSRSNESSYIVKLYKEELVNQLTILNPQITWETWLAENGSISNAATIRQTLTSHGYIVLDSIVDLSGADETKQFMKTLSWFNGKLEALKDFKDYSRWVGEAANTFMSFFNDYEVSLQILGNMRKSSTYQSDRNYQDAVDELLSSYSSSINRSFGYLMDEINKKLGDDIIEDAFYELGSAFFKTLTSGQFKTAFKLTALCAEGVFEVTGVNELGESAQALLIKQDLFSTSRIQYRDAFEHVYNGDYSSEALNGLYLSFHVAQTAGVSLYETLVDYYNAENFWGVHQYDEESQRLVGLMGELKWLIYKTPYASN